MVAWYHQLNGNEFEEAQGVGDGHSNTRLYLRQIINKDLLFSTGDSAQCCVMTYMRKESKKE